MLLRTVRLWTVRGCATRDTIVQQERKRILPATPVTGTGAGEAVQQSSDAAKDDELPRLEGEEVGLLTTTV